MAKIDKAWGRCPQDFAIGKTLLTGTVSALHNLSAPTRGSSGGRQAKIPHLRMVEQSFSRFAGAISQSGSRYS